MAQTRKTFAVYAIRIVNGRKQFVRQQYNRVHVTDPSFSPGGEFTALEPVCGGRFKSDQERDIVYDGIDFVPFPEGTNP